MEEVSRVSYSSTGVGGDSDGCLLTILGWSGFGTMQVFSVAASFPFMIAAHIALIVNRRNGHL